jgi:hypothetical protein
VEKQGRADEAAAAFGKALEIYVAIDDQHGASVVFNSFAHLWATTTAPSVPTAVATVLNISVDEATTMLEEVANTANEALPQTDES